MTKTINLKILIDVLKKAWWKVLIFTVIVAVATGVITEFLVPKKYTSSVEFMVNNASATSEYTTTALTSAVEYLAKDYVTIISGDEMVQMIKEYISDPNRDVEGTYADISEAQIRNMITSQTSTEGSSMFTITATATEDKLLAYYVAECISNYAPGIIKGIVNQNYSTEIYKKVTMKDEHGNAVKDEDGNDKFTYEKVTNTDVVRVTVIRSPIVAHEQSSPDVTTCIAIAALLAAAASYIFFVIFKLFDNVIASEEDIREKVNKTVMGDIPDWSGSASNRTAYEENK